MGLFERFLSVWVGLGILAGVGLGLWIPQAFQLIAAAELLFSGIIRHGIESETGFVLSDAGFSALLAGGGIKGGVTHGATDDFGYHAAENIVEVFDLHATMLHLLGIDHERLTFRFQGRDYRLTDVHGKVVREILA